MPFFISILVLFCCMTSASHAGEVDPFLAAGTQIRDCSSEINRHLNASIIEILADHPIPSSTSCEAAALHIMEQLGAQKYLFVNVGALNCELELWVEENEQIDKVPSDNRNGTNDLDTIYAPKLTFFGLWPTTVDPTINVSGINLGTEKLSHFLGSGYEYYKRYLGAIDTLPRRQAELNIIDWGIAMENTVIGVWAVGVFSYADLEANYQGYTMARDLCAKGKLKIHDDRWQLVQQVNIGDYVNPNWDEGYNTSGYTANRDKKVRGNLEQSQQCQSICWECVADQHQHYASWPKTRQDSSGFLDSSLSSSILALSRMDAGVNQEQLYTRVQQQYALPLLYRQWQARDRQACSTLPTLPLHDYCQTIITVPRSK
ncbi:MAG: hypothetical protein JRG71_00585 [Deltaproteobacteria bacterium]|nr:hypothetical protein [Deltaproteobacteria bacterium]